MIFQFILSIHSLGVCLVGSSRSCKPCCLQATRFSVFCSPTRQRCIATLAFMVICASTFFCFFVLFTLYSFFCLFFSSWLNTSFSFGCSCTLRLRRRSTYRAYLPVLFSDFAQLSSEFPEL